MKHDWLNSFLKNLTPPLKNFTFHCQKTLFSNLIEPRAAQFELKLSSLLFDEEIKKILICEIFFQNLQISGKHKFCFVS